MENRCVKAKTRCPACGKEFISLNGPLAKGSGPCATFRTQRLIEAIPGSFVWLYSKIQELLNWLPL